ncbi:MAG: NADH-quinone oxidoreductase subunit D [Candidatus Gastranaerophilales bacterium]|nr:NADH-quinone oxidoreductase subunit D [Candidatus Gastranaerophilales bacterium]
MTTALDNREMLINIGPQHPSTHGVLRLKMRLEGEIIKDTEPIIGYLHRGMEKLAESRSYCQYLPMVDRIDYLSSFFNLASFCMAVENLSEFEVPGKAQYIRVITMELNRIASHLLWLGSFLLDMGATSPLFYTFREREEIIKLFEDLAGARLLYNYYCFGGVKKDIPEGWDKKVLEVCKKLPKYIKEYEAIITKNPIVLERTKCVGVLDKTTALSYGITGPNLRASGVNYDLRKVKPYSVYNELNFKVCTAQNGDCHDRYRVRVDEMLESVKIIEQAIKKLPDQEDVLFTKKIAPAVFKAPEGETVSLIESPRGITACYLTSDGTIKPQRVKWRTGSFSAVQLLPELIKNRQYADLMPILGSLDIVLPEVDR